MKFLIFILLTSYGLTTHDIHISVTEIQQKEYGIEVMSKIFLDDLQHSMGLIPGEELPEDYKGADDMIQRFIDENFKVRINDQNLKLKLTKTEAAMPAVWATFEISDINWSEENTLSIENNMMIHLFDDQKNIVKIKLQNLEKEKVLDGNETKAVFSF